MRPLRVSGSFAPQEVHHLTGLMTNPAHKVVVPATDDGLQRMQKPLHMRYAQRINRVQNGAGLIWQGRFFSSPLYEAYGWTAVRYVERNPVRAGMAESAENYQWSSAVAHCGNRTDCVLALESGWRKQFAAKVGRLLEFQPQGRSRKSEDEN